MKSMVEVSHAFLRPVMHKGAVLVDGTLGNGQDAAFLLKSANKVYAFEIQEDIAKKTEERIGDTRLEVIVDSHAHIDQYVKEQIDGAVFNFGWCPGKENGITTEAGSSLEAVQKTLALLKKKGRMALVFYPHMDGKEEGETILAWVKTLDHREVPVQRVEPVNCDRSPWCLLLEKRK